MAGCTTALLSDQFPPGTPVRVTQTSRRRAESVATQVVGVVEEWEDLPTGSWYAHGAKDKLWLQRLKLRKADGEIALLIVDDHTSLAKLAVSGA